MSVFGWDAIARIGDPMPMDGRTMAWCILIGVFGVGALDFIGVLPGRGISDMSGRALRAGVFYGGGIAVAFIVAEAFRRLRKR